ncbi:MAG: hypothetical protein HZB50_18860 [Chloroflexi bacterium]|nr:hypothetical protein [Chloroflexota bacterium]
MFADVMRYELPPEGISLLGYIVRRMHKTELLAKVPALLKDGQNKSALEAIAIYAATSSTSFGHAYYQPRFNRVGESVEEADPQTGAKVRATLQSDSPHYHILYTVAMPNGDAFTGEERITGTTVGLRGLGMPAPSKFNFKSGDYEVNLTGVLTSELALSLFGKTKIRAYGSLTFNDNKGNSGKLTLDRDNKTRIEMTA